MDTTPTLHVRKAAVLGAGVMGAQIAAHLVNANVPTILFDLPAKEGDLNGIVTKALVGLKKLKPGPLAVPEKADDIIPANYEQHLSLLEDCDLVIEAIAERLDLKEDLYKKVAPYLNPQALFVTNTSGLSITTLANVLPEEIRNQFCGVHFFNPPRYMHLVEIIPHATTDKKLLPGLETFLVNALGKGVVYAKDTPNFIANRVGVFSILATLHHAQELNISLEVVDALTGPAIGRPKSATLRTADVVGLDTLAHVINTMTQNLKSDPWAKYYQVPTWLQALIGKGALGQKTGVGIYKKIGNQILVWDLQENDYRPADRQPSEDVLKILKIKNPAEKLTALRVSTHPEAQFLWRIFRDLFHYAAAHTKEIADTVRDIDLAIRWGFGWQQGIFEFWQSAGWQTVAHWIEADRSANKTMCSMVLPQWVMAVHGEGVYNKNGAYSPARDNFQPRSQLPIYKQQRFLAPILGEIPDEGKTIFETDAVRLWHDGDGIAILNFKSKMNTVSMGVIDGIFEAIKCAEKDYKGLILWQRQGDNFSLGANLAEVDLNNVGGAVKNFQDASMALRYAKVPVISAIRGMTLGGACELSMHCSRIVAAFETYIGLPEVGVGLLPAGGGLKELALRAVLESRGDDPFRDLQNYFKQAAMGEVSTSAEDAKRKNYLRATDIIVMNTDEILYVAKQCILSLVAAGYRPPLSPRIPVVGKPGIATLMMLLVNMREGGFISDYDYIIGCKVAETICGGNIEAGSIVDEEWYLRLEREAFMTLAQDPRTQDRIKHMLTTGKPLRN